GRRAGGRGRNAEPLPASAPGPATRFARPILLRPILPWTAFRTQQRGRPAGGARAATTRPHRLQGRRNSPLSSKPVLRPAVWASRSILRGRETGSYLRGGHAGRPNQPQPEPNMIRFAEASADEPPILADASDTERLGDEIAELAAHIHAATHRLL